MNLRGKGANLADLSVYDEDAFPSTSGTWTEDRGSDVIWVLRVPGLGAIVIRAIENRHTKKLGNDGVSTFTEAEIEAGRVHVS